MSRRKKKPGYADPVMGVGGGGSRPTSFWEPGYDGGYTGRLATYHYYRLTNLCVSMFDWQGLPESVDARYLELALFADGAAVFFEDEVLGVVATRVNVTGPKNVYDNPTRVDAYGANGYHRTLDPSECVLVWNDYMRRPTLPDVDMFARTMANMDATIGVNVSAQKTPVTIRCPENMVPTVKRMYEQYDGNAPVIVANDKVDPNAIGVLITGAPFTAPDIYNLKIQYNNEFLTSRGISNVNVTKRERMITEEVQRNLGATVASRYSPLEMRRKACEEINAKWDLSVSCDFHEDYRDIEAGVDDTVDPAAKPDDGEE